MPVCFLRCLVWLVSFAFIALCGGSGPARAGDDARPAPSPPSAAAPVSQAQFIVQAVQLMDQKKHADAVTVLSEALSLYPNDETLLSVRFDALRRAGRYAEALDDINAALKVTPYNASKIADRARICLELRQFDQAIADASKAISINPKIALFFFVRSEAYRMTGKLREALADLDRVVSLVPNSDSVTLTVRGG
jgi:tetratricopeptide (TPR) repeat protein